MSSPAKSEGSINQDVAANATIEEMRHPEKTKGNLLESPQMQQRTRNFSRRIGFLDDSALTDPLNDSTFQESIQNRNLTEAEKRDEWYRALKPTHKSSANEYTGMRLPPGQISILPTFNPLPHGSTKSTCISLSQKENMMRALDENLRSTCAPPITTACKASDLGDFSNSPEGSHSELNLGMNVDTQERPSHVAKSNTQHQIGDFQDLAKQHGIRQWNNQVNDDRWALRPEEIWNAQSEDLQNLMAYRDAPNIGSEESAIQIPDSEPAETLRDRIEQLSEDLQETQIKVQAMQNKEFELAPSHQTPNDGLPPVTGYTLGEALSVQDQAIFEPPEPRLLSQYVYDLSCGTGTGRLPRGLPHDPKLIRKEFYRVVFGTTQPAPLSHTEEHKLVKYNGVLTTQGQLRKLILDDIDDIVASMVFPVGQGLRDTLKSPLSAGRGGDKKSRESSIGSDATIKGPSTPREKSGPEQDLECDRQSTNTTMFSSKMSKLVEDDQVSYSTCHGDGPIQPSIATAKSSTPEVVLPTSKKRPTSPMAGAPPGLQHSTFNTAAPPFYPGPAALPNPANSAYESQYIHQPWRFEAQQYHSFQAYSTAPFDQAGYSMQHYQQPLYGMYDTINACPQMLGDRLVRPPAASRLAPLYAQSPPFSMSVPLSQPSQMPIGNRMEFQAAFGIPSQASRHSTNRLLLPFRSGADDMYPRGGGSVSLRLKEMTMFDPPEVNLALDQYYLPFGETTKMSMRHEWGVLKISNIPYDITTATIVSFLGNHAKLITPDLGPAVHINMDRSTGKTQDAFVEFFSVLDAKAWVSVIRSRPVQLNRIGDRLLEVELSSQEELLAELFPRAKSVSWNGGIDGKQVVTEEPKDPFDSGFKGFVTTEELQSLVRHAEQPHRSIYTQKCLPRPYAAMISILAKFPWHATKLYTLATRDNMFKATLTMIRHLVSVLQRPPSTSVEHQRDSYAFGQQAFANMASLVPGSGSSMQLSGSRTASRSSPQRATNGLNDTLLRDLTMAGLNAYGFSDKQRWDIVQTAAPIVGRQVFRLSPLARAWPFETLGRKSGYEEDVVQFYAHLISTHPTVLAASRTFAPNFPSSTLPFGTLASFYIYLDMDATTLDDMAKHEMRLLTTIVREQCTTAARTTNPTVRPRMEDSAVPSLFRGI